MLATKFSNSGGTGLLLAKALSKQERILSLAENKGRKEEIAKKKNLK